LYAIVRTGGKQYRMAPGETVHVERLSGGVGEAVTFDEVLLVGGGDGEPRVGAPQLEGAAVKATVVEQGRDQKIRVFKYKKRKHYRRTRGHRQAYTAVRVDAIEA
jgi:large subunit ribosomal protein L21